MLYKMVSCLSQLYIIITREKGLKKYTFLVNAILQLMPSNGTTESVMCDVIKICLKRKDERRSGKGNP